MWLVGFLFVHPVPLFHFTTKWLKCPTKSLLFEKETYCFVHWQIAFCRSILYEVKEVVTSGYLVHQFYIKFTYRHHEYTVDANKPRYNHFTGFSNLFLFNTDQCWIWCFWKKAEKLVHKIVIEIEETYSYYCLI